MNYAEGPNLSDCRLRRFSFSRFSPPTVRKPCPRRTFRTGSGPIRLSSRRIWRISSVRFGKRSEKIRSDPRFIRTVPRYGYAFLDPAAEINESTPGARPATSRWRRTALALAAAGLVTAIGYAAWSLLITPPTTNDSRIMLAVLPFQNLTGDPEQQYLCDGLTEEMIAHLGGADPSRLGVIARTSAMHYKNTTKRADEIASELGVAYLLETSVRRIGDRVRVTAQLIEAQTQGHVWAEQYERDALDLLALQREVAAAVARRTLSSLGISVGHRDARAARHSNNARAYEHYLRGRYHWTKDTIDGLQKARDNFQKAIELDPSYARAYSGLAETYALLGSYGIMPISESHPLGRGAALRALELDESLAEAHRSLAAIIGDHYWDWGEVGTALHASDRARPERRHDPALLFFLPGVHGTAPRGVAHRRASVPPRSGVSERSDEPWRGPASGPAARRGRAAIRGDP